MIARRRSEGSVSTTIAVFELELNSLFVTSAVSKSGESAAAARLSRHDGDCQVTELLMFKLPKFAVTCLPATESVHARPPKWWQSRSR